MSNAFDNELKSMPIKNEFPMGKNTSKNLVLEFKCLISKLDSPFIFEIQR